MLRDWGQERKYNHVLKGFNYRMEGFQGAVLGVKLRYLEDWTEARRRHAQRYDKLLADSGVLTPAVKPDCRHVYHVYAVRVAERDAFHKALLAKGIHTGIHYPVPVHLQPAFADLGYKSGDFPIAEKAAAEVLSLPMYAELSEAELDSVCSAVKEVYNAANE
jgi:dTDP-4-amino-4,6-dideoxygalactose transaminase